VTVGVRPILLRFFCAAAGNNTAGSGVVVALYESTTQLQQGNRISSGANNLNALDLSVRLAPSAGEHTYTAEFAAITSGTASVAAGATFPTYLQAWEC
jgi:hypothetical protein